MATKNTDAIALLTADHREVDALLSDYDRETNNVSARRAIAAKVCAALTVHAMIEEEIFYPAVRACLPSEEDEVDEALVEHFLVKTLIDKFERMTTEEQGFDAAFKVLAENVQHHVKEEEEEMFPAVRKSSLDLADIGARMEKRKSELMQKIANVAT